MSETLRPAVELANLHNRRFPNESPQFRKARTALLAEEIELRRHIERVAQMRRDLPRGGEIPEDYVFVGENGRPVKLSEMFGKHDTLIVYNWMFGPNRPKACPMCTAMLSSIEGEARDIQQRVALAIVGRAPIEKQLAFKKSRGWQHLKFYSSEKNDFNHAYVLEKKDYNGEDNPGFNVFLRQKDGRIVHTYGDEMGMETADPGQDPRGAPDIMPMWTLFDLTPHGRVPSDWYPELDYPDDK